MSFESIANELVVTILEHISRQDLPSISLCNRRLHSLVEPLLYSTFTQTTRRTISLFLRTILSRPDLVKHVKHLHALDRWDSGTLEDITEEPQRAALRAYMPEEILGSELCSNWSSEFFCRGPEFKEEWPTWDAEIAHLLVLFSALETIDFKWYWQPFSYVQIGEDGVETTVYTYPSIRAVLQASVHAPSLLPHLHSVSLSGHLTADNQLQTVELEHFRIYHMVPSVTSLHGHGVSSSPTAYPSSDLNTHTTSISLTKSDINPDDLRRFLNSFHNLREFEYGHGNDDDQPLVPDVIPEALITSKHSLLSLKITTRILPGQPDRPIIGSLSDFSALRVLDVDIHALIECVHIQPGVSGYESQAEAINIFPEHLERVTLRCCTANTNSCLNALFLQRSVLRELKSLKLVASSNFDFDSMALRDGKVEIPEWEAEVGKRGVVVLREVV